MDWLKGVFGGIGIPTSCSPAVLDHLALPTVTPVWPRYSAARHMVLAMQAAVGENRFMPRTLLAFPRRGIAMNALLSCLFRKPVCRRSAVRLRVRPSLEILEDRLAPAVFTVTTANDSGAGSLRVALTSANMSAGADTIQFNIPGAGTHVIPLSS